MGSDEETSGLGIRLDGGEKDIVDRLAFLVEGNVRTCCEGKVGDIELERLTCAVDGDEIPSIAMATSEDDILAWITVDNAGLIPCCGDGLEEIDALLGCVGQIVWRKGEELHRVLEGYGRGEGEDL